MQNPIKTDFVKVGGVEVQRMQRNKNDAMEGSTGDGVEAKEATKAADTGGVLAASTLSIATAEDADSGKPEATATTVETEVGVDLGKGHAPIEVMLLDGREVHVVKKMPGGRWQILDTLDRKKKWVEVKNLVAVEASNDEAVECSGIKEEGASGAGTAGAGGGGAPETKDAEGGETSEAGDAVSVYACVCVRACMEGCR